MFDEFTDGYCPQCLLDNQRVEMILNENDFWECAACHLQAHSGSHGMFALLRERGVGELKSTKATKTRSVIGSVLTKAHKDERYSADLCGFPTEAALREFLTNEVKIS